MRLLITGALGHVGSRFIRSLPPDSIGEVVLLDNLSTQRYCSLFDLPSGVPFRFVEADICDDGLRPHVEGVDVVLHLAAITNAAESFAVRDEVERVNLGGTIRVGEACAAAGARMVFLSTTSVYGSQSNLVDERCTELRPQSPYADSKLRAEAALRALGEERGLRYVIYRCGTIFGPSIGMRFHTAINKFVWQACLGRPITVWRTALNQQRPYLALDDAVRALSFAIEHDLFDNDLYNVVTLNATVAEIVMCIESLVPDLAIEYVDSPMMNQLSYAVSAEKLARRGFEAKGQLRPGIGETVRLLQSLTSRAGRLARL